jgi:hypothetical protein
MRSTEERKKHILELLAAGKRDVWVATAGRSGRPHLVPFSLGWDGTHVVVATEASFITARNLESSHQARLAVGDTRDVNLIDAISKTVAMRDLDAAVADDFATRNGWDPRNAKGSWVWLVLTPKRILCWNNETELDGRTVMDHGVWKV